MASSRSRRLPKTGSTGGAILKRNGPDGTGRIKHAELIAPLSYATLNYSVILHILHYCIILCNTVTHASPFRGNSTSALGPSYCSLCSAGPGTHPTELCCSECSVLSPGPPSRVALLCSSWLQVAQGMAPSSRQGSAPSPATAGSRGVG